MAPGAQAEAQRRGGFTLAVARVNLDRASCTEHRECVNCISEPNGSVRPSAIAFFAEGAEEKDIFITSAL